MGVISVIDDEVELNTDIDGIEGALMAVLLNHDDEVVEGIMEIMLALEGQESYSYAPRRLALDLENRGVPHLKPPIKKPPTLELKPLPSHLEYKFLGPNDSLPVIIPSKLNESQVEALLSILRTYKRAIKWTIVDI
ncbi:hypothetical protein RND71_003606 [Anisodus tanguticus]|uniref:Reverse transcriptase domain-containing protein n=1 Tax=Anisodus tanguticus TaxID=243964 RepID=A0AAE1SW52_9SOLA|nr:hypothetical protein RND71_003606 [Anisodus tanguticus]